MDAFQEVTRKKERFLTPRGPLSVEQLWDLPLGELDNLAVELEDKYNNSKGKSFLDKRTVKDRTLKVKFDVVLEILNTKSEEADKAKLAKEKKANNEKIIRLISEKQDESLKGKSIKQLEAMLEDEDDGA